MTESFLQSEDGLWYLLERFRNHTLPGAEWRHPAHLAVATMDIIHSHPDEVTVGLRYGIKSYLNSLNAANTAYVGYHETMTQFWIHEIRRFIATGGLRTESDLEIVRAVVNHYRHKKDIWKNHYDFDIMSSRVARFYYVVPNK